MCDIESGDFTSCVRNVRRLCVAVRVLRYVPKHSPATASARVNAPSRPLDREDICPMLFKNMNLDKRIIIYPINQDLIWMVAPYKSHDLSWFQTPARNLALDRLRLLQVLLLGSTFNWAECIAKWCPTPTWQLFSQAAHGSGNGLSHTPPWSSKAR